MCEMLQLRVHLLFFLYKKEKRKEKKAILSEVSRVLSTQQNKLQCYRIPRNSNGGVLVNVYFPNTLKRCRVEIYSLCSGISNDKCSLVTPPT